MLGEKAKNMLKRFGYLYSIGGWNCFLRTLLMLLVATGISVVEYKYLGGLYCALMTVVLTAAGWFFRKTIMEIGPQYRRYARRIFTFYGVLLFIVVRADLGRQVQLAVICLACVAIFNLNFWSISEAAIVDEENAANEGRG
ncbi:MAG: hypothetical protein ACK5Z0_03370 [Planctomycetota bacterium]